MDFSRRDLAILLSVLTAEADAAPQRATQQRVVPAANAPMLSSKGYQFSELPIRTNAVGMTSRPVFNGMTTRGQHITAHISELPPGQAPHPPERQAHDEIFVIREGTVEATLNGQTSTFGPGSVLFFSYNELNGLKNVGATTAQYYVISLE